MHWNDPDHVPLRRKEGFEYWLMEFAHSQIFKTNGKGATSISITIRIQFICSSYFIMLVQN